MGTPGGELSEPVRALLAQLSAAFPGLGGEVRDAGTARRMLAGAPRRTPTPVARVEERIVPGADPDGAGLAVRCYWPADGAGPRPGIVFFHGGGFVLCDLDSHDGLCREMALRCGAVVVSADYRRAPEARYPAAAQDCFAVTRWVAGHAAELGVDAARLSVAGDSAGGNLAATVALMARATSGPDLRAQVLFYPMLDPARDSASQRSFGTGHFLTAEHLRWYWECYLGPGATGFGTDACAPVSAVDLAGLPPALVVLAGADPLHDEGAVYAGRLAAASTATTLLDFPGLFHGFLGFGEQLEEVAAATAQIYPVLRALVH